MKQTLTLVPVQILNNYYTITLHETIKRKHLMKYGYLGKMTKCLNFLYMSENDGKKLTRSWGYFGIKIL